MNKSRRTCCIDANILFDFVAGDIFDILFLLPFDFHTSDIVADEISDSYSDKQLTQSGLEILTLDDSEVLEIFTLKQEHIELSVEDVSVYFLSRKHNTIILSNDGPLRELADSSRIEYHGTLWLLEEMIQGEILTPQDAAVALISMLDNKRWLPRSECEKLIKKWKSEE
jgi:rRNA-processing protein FCF1